MNRPLASANHFEDFIKVEVKPARTCFMNELICAALRILESKEKG